MEEEKVTNEEFDMALMVILGELTASQLLTIPGIYEIVSEWFNNQAIDMVREWREMK